MAENWSPDHPLIGRILQSRFQIASFIREGGMAQVFCGVQDEEPRHIAIKIMHPELADDEEIVGRFLREARVARALNHPNIVRIVSADEDRELLFIVMELLFGDDLSARVKMRGSFTEARATEIMIDVFSALNYAHENGVIHRDIKPENVMLCRQPNAPAEEVVKVLDFGIAKILDETPGVNLPSEAPTGIRSVLTRVGTWVGTPAYMSPEQGSAEPLDHRSDLYSAGVLLYELITGRVPFDGQTPLQIIARHVRDEVPKPSSFQEIHPGLEDLIMRLLSKRPQDRPQSAIAVAQELSFLLGDLSVATSERWFQSIGPNAPRQPPPPALAAPAAPVATAPASVAAPASAASALVDDDSPTGHRPSAADSTMRSAGNEPNSPQSLRALRRTMAMSPDEVVKATAEAQQASALAQQAAGRVGSLSGARPPHPLLGRVLGKRYQLASFIREGSVAQVFVATVLGTQNAVAIKVLHPSLAHDREIVSRFIREAQLAARLTHPNIVRTLEAQEDDGVLYMVMELLFGDDLSARVKQPGSVSQERAVQIAADVCRALEHAHKLNIVHRDIKPENVMLCRLPDAPERETVKVLDFGIAKVLDAKDQITLPAEATTAVRSVLTRVGALVGTPAYMSPEQGSAKPADNRSDIYSLGVLLFELLCGRLPFTGETALQIVARHIHDAPPRPSSIVPMPRRLEEVVLRALAKDPNQRFQSATQMLAALEDSLSQLGRAHTDSGVASDRWLRRTTGRGMALPAQTPIAPAVAQAPAAPPRPAPPQPTPAPQAPPPASGAVSSSSLAAVKSTVKLDAASASQAVIEARKAIAAAGAAPASQATPSAAAPSALAPSAPATKAATTSGTAAGSSAAVAPIASTDVPDKRKDPKIDKLVKLVTVLLVMLAVACVAILILLYAFVANR